MYSYFSVGNGQRAGNRHCANCIDALSFRADKMAQLMDEQLQRYITSSTLNSWRRARRHRPVRHQLITLQSN